MHVCFLINRKKKIVNRQLTFIHTAHTNLCPHLSIMKKCLRNILRTKLDNDSSKRKKLNDIIC